ncbi:HD-GYP domain-containing protein [Delftia sp. PS-11]|uniref:HD-GYP domain-containing protein n=1 Tax=Delftia sp. PS-11 TaxID=2767222 RepID=UPI002457C91B|nr:phosphodiesterase [Delftia sp. PS-11]KAJ8744684.1 phosphodiesterase [Delftia sp. PS-11]
MSQPHHDSYEDLLGLWSDLEAALSVLLSAPLRVQDFLAKLEQTERWLQELIAHDTDAALYLMFQRACSSTVGYGAAHALVCACLCYVLGRELGLPAAEHQALVRGALTMNIGMNALQDELALQREPLTPAQQQAVQRHPLESQALLARLFVTNPLWLELVECHHDNVPHMPLAQLSPVHRLVRILGTVDRYAALISPRKSREGRNATESLRTLAQQPRYSDEVSHALARCVGIYPPGTYVRLDNGDIGVVLRRGDEHVPPQVASVVNAQGSSLYPPVVHTADKGPRIRSELARAAVTLELDPRALAQLGILAARGSQALYGMLKVPGTL